MEIQMQEHGGVLILRVLASRIDASIAVEFKNAVRTIIDAGSHELVLDLSRVEFIDSSGLGAIVGTMKHLGHRGSLALTGLSRPVERVFQLTRMDRVFRIYTSVDAAAAAAE